ncbi:chorismate--pyruvate lyase family protein [Glaciecola siphonariae]|uniref:Probable chorismate pyruvate-lyase n=1 Tax=Glaciecola siphonariae TaxID=521012 RepID=A0ABV9LXV8_9ALTE
MLVNSLYPFGLAVRWAKAESFVSLPANMKDWLLDTGSLTERLQGLCTSFNVELLGQSVLPLSAAEKSILSRACHHAEQQTWQIREVILFGDGVPWVFARSALPDAMCQSSLANIGTQPLGQRIFNDPQFVRSDFEIGQLEEHPLSHRSFAASTSHQQRWARRSVFSSGDDTVLVAEAFLPDCPCYEGAS